MRIDRFLANGRAQRAAINQDAGRTRLQARRQVLQYSSSGRTIRTSLFSAGTGKSEARLRLASRTSSVATSLSQFSLDYHFTNHINARPTLLAATPASREEASVLINIHSHFADNATHFSRVVIRAVNPDTPAARHHI